MCDGLAAIVTLPPSGDAADGAVVAWWAAGAAFTGAAFFPAAALPVFLPWRPLVAGVAKAFYLPALYAGHLGRPGQDFLDEVVGRQM